MLTEKRSIQTTSQMIDLVQLNEDLFLIIVLLIINYRGTTFVSQPFTTKDSNEKDQSSNKTHFVENGVCFCDQTITGHILVDLFVNPISIMSGTRADGGNNQIQ